MNLIERTPWLTALTNLATATSGEAKRIGPDTASSCEDELSKFLNQQGAKSAKSPSNTLLSLLALPHIRNLAARSVCESVKPILVEVQRP
jgi:hypothetical protein